MSECIACGKISKPVATWQTTDNITNNQFEIEFCACGLGKTIISNNDHPSTTNDLHYNDLENRIKIYYKEQFNHISIRYVIALNEIKKHTKGTKLLEVGSNIGFTLNIAQKNNFDVEGCEINTNCRELSQKLFPIPVHENFFEIDDSYDIIIMNDVLEHFPNPAEALKKAFRLLKTDGILFIQLPNVSSKNAKKQKGTWQYVLAPDHTYHFTPSSLTNFCLRHGFEQKWIRCCSPVSDMKIMNIFPENLKAKIIKLLYANPFHFPRLYTRKEGVLIQGIFKKK